MSYEEDSSQDRINRLSNMWCYEYNSLTIADRRLLDAHIAESKEDILANVETALQIAAGDHDQALFYPLMSLVSYILQQSKKVDNDEV